MPASARSWVGFGALLLAGALVFWAYDALPFQDLPAHAGLIALRHRFSASPFEQRFFVLAPHLGPYTLFRTLGDGLCVWLGPVGAVRALATLSFVAVPLALIWSRHRLHGETSPTAGFLGIALGFGFTTVMGFASFWLGVALLLVLLTLWLDLMVAADDEDRAARRYEVAVACGAPLLLLAHGYALLVFLEVAGVTCVAWGRVRRRLLRARSLAPTLALAAWMAWRSRAAAVPVGSVGPSRTSLQLHFQGAIDKISLLLSPTLLTRWGLDVALGALLWLVLGAAVVSSARHEGDPRARAHTRALVAAIATLSVTFLALPHSVGWFGFVDGRLVPMILLLGALAVRGPALRAPLEAAYRRFAPLAAVSMVGIALVASWRFQREATGWQDVLGAVPEKSRLLNLPLAPDSAVFTGHPFVHYDKLVLVAGPAVVSDVWFHQGTALYPTAANPSLGLPSSYSESALGRIDWAAYRLGDWDYVLIRDRPGDVPPGVPSSLALAAHAGGWWLYRTSSAAAGPRILPLR